MKRSSIIAFAAFVLASTFSVMLSASSPSAIQVVHADSVGGSTDKVAALVHYNHARVLDRLSTSGGVTVEVQYAIGDAQVFPQSIAATLAPAQDLVLLGELKIDFDGDIVIGTARITVSVGQVSWTAKQPVVFVKTANGVRAGTVRDWLLRHERYPVQAQTAADAMKNLEPGDVPGEGRGRQSIPCTTEVCLGGAR